MSCTAQELEEFKVEALELLDTAEKGLLSLDLGSDYKVAFDSIFRGFHNLKGAAGMMELTELQSHTHRLEDILMQFKEQNQIPKEYIGLFLQGIDVARAILNGEQVHFDYGIGMSNSTNVVEASPESVSQPAVESSPDGVRSEFAAEVEEIVDRVSDVLQLIEKKTFSKSDVEALYRDVHSLKGAAYLFNSNTLGDIAHAMESSLEEVRDGTRAPSDQLINSLYKCLQVIEKESQVLIQFDKVESVEQQVSPLIQELLEAAKQLQPVEGGHEDQAIPRPISDSPVTESPQRQTKIEKETEGTSSIRVPVSLLDNLMTLMGEMVLVRNQVLQFSSKSEDLEFINLSKRLNVVTSEIQGEMMKTRMQPIGNILSKFNRVVRDLSHELGKEITLELHGSETELDKSLLESIKDPLTHIVRNSCDHGIELPEVRRQSGKPQTGKIIVRSYHEGGQVVIEVSDDGKGLRRDKLINKALEKGLITSTQASGMSEKEVFSLIFAPGFSTAANITNVSGRGVGMDVVRTNVERIGGSVELSSIAGRGTNIKLKIPLTLAIVPALIVKSGEETFAIPQVKLEELVRVEVGSEENRIEDLHGSPVYRLRGNILPLVSLNKVLKFDETVPTARSQAVNIAVLSADHYTFGLLVDEIQDTADIVVKPLNRLLKSLQVYSGATILGDGSIALILDVLGIAKVAQLGAGKAREDHASQQEQDMRVAENQDFLLMKLNSVTKHAIVLNYVHRLEEFKTADIEHSGKERVIRYGKTVLPLLDLSEILGYGPRKDSAPVTTLPVVVIKKAGQLFGLMVDEIVDTLSTCLEVDTSLNRQQGIFGNLNMSEELVVVIDPFELINISFPENQVTPVGKFRLLETVEKKSAQATQISNLKLRVLLVEDTVFFRRAIANVLESVGHHITVAVDGRDALDKLEKSPSQYDLIVSDIEMPRMNGFELAEAVRANKDLCSLPLLAISSRADKGYTDRGIKSGFNVYLEKLKPKVLLEAVSSITMEKAE